MQWHLVPAAKAVVLDVEIAAMNDGLSSPPLFVAVAVFVMLCIAAALNEQRESTDCSYRPASYRCEMQAPRTVNAEPQPASPDRNEWRQENALEAQWGQVYWAKFAGFVSALALLITGVGAILVKSTLDATRAAVTEATKGTEAATVAAKAAEEANKIVRQAYVLEQRPWLMWSVSEPVALRRFGSHLQLALGVVFTNVGKTPALEIAPRGLLFVVGDDERGILNKGFDFHIESFEDYVRGVGLSRRLDLLPSENTPQEVSASIAIKDIPGFEDGKATRLYFSFHLAYKFFDRETIAQAAAVYYVQSSEMPTPFSSEWTMDSFNITRRAKLAEVPSGGRRIT